MTQHTLKTLRETFLINYLNLKKNLLAFTLKDFSSSPLIKSCGEEERKRQKGA